MRLLVITASLLALTACDPRPDSQISGSALLEMLSGEEGPEVTGIETTLLKTARAANESGQHNRALQFYKQLADKNPDNMRYQLGIADNFRRLQKLDEAVHYYDIVLKRSPGNVEALEGKGLTLLNKIEFKQAGSLFEKVMEKDPKRWRTLNAIGVLFVAKNLPDDALAYYEAALNVKPDSPAVLNNVGLTMALTEDYRRAIMALERASLKLEDEQPQKKRADLNLALVYGLAGKMDKATVTAKKHLSDAALNNNLGFYAYLADNKELATAYLNHALSGSSTFYKKAWENLEMLGESSDGIGYGRSGEREVLKSDLYPFDGGVDGYLEGSDEMHAMPLDEMRIPNKVSKDAIKTPVNANPTKIVPLEVQFPPKMKEKQQVKRLKKPDLKPMSSNVTLPKTSQGTNSVRLLKRISPDEMARQVEPQWGDSPMQKTQLGQVPTQSEKKVPEGGEGFIDSVMGAVWR